MKLWLAIFFISSIVGCADLPYDAQNVDHNIDVFEQQGAATVRLDITNEGSLMTGSLVLNLACSNVFGSSSNDWTQNSVGISSGGSVTLVSGKACTITMVSYNDGTNTYTAASTSLVINVSSTGTVTGPASPLQYNSSGPSQWFSAAQGASTYTATINYAAQTVSNTSITTANTSTTALTVTLAATAISAPSVSSVTITQSESNDVFQYTLTASVSGSPLCRFIDNSSGTYNPTSGISVDSAYSSSNSASCPTLTPGSATTGNWTSYWNYNVYYLVIWANTVNGFRAYTTANIGPGA